MDDDEGSLLSDPLLQRLFRLFILFSETTVLGQQRITPEQAHFIVNSFFRISRTMHSPHTIPVITRSESVTFRELIRICDLLFPDRRVLGPVVDRAFERFVSQIIAKGFLMCRKVGPSKGCIQRGRRWRTYWCTLAPGALHLWPLHKPTTICNTKLVTLDESFSVDVGPFEEERFTWILSSPTSSEFIFGHFDELRRSQWIAEMQMGIERRTKSDLLEHDRACSKKAENLTPSEKNLTWRLALEYENSRLMQLLDDERRALHDEEIVRTLAARMLEEEREKREKLEKKLSDVESHLESERKKSTSIAIDAKSDSNERNGARYIIAPKYA